MKQYRAKIFVIGGLFFFLGTSALAEENDINIIIEKNLFSPTRQKYVPSPKTAAKKPISKAMLPELCGTIISGDNKRAVFSFRQSSRPAPAPVSRTTRRTHGKKGKIAPAAPVITPRSNDTRVVSVGERFGDYRLLAIEDKQVTLECDGEKIQLYTRR